MCELSPSSGCEAPINSIQFNSIQFIGTLDRNPQKDVLLTRRRPASNPTKRNETKPNELVKKIKMGASACKLESANEIDETQFRNPSLDFRDGTSRFSEHAPTNIRTTRRSIFDGFSNREDGTKHHRRIFWSSGVVRSERLNKLHIPREEFREVTKLDQGAAIKPLEYLYVIRRSWVMRWLLFATRGLEIPGPIDNVTLINPKTGCLRNSCKFNSETSTGWRVVNSQVWRYLYAIYGGGPIIKIQIPEHMNYEKEQRACEEQQAVVDAARERLRTETLERENLVRSGKSLDGRHAQTQRERLNKQLIMKLTDELDARNRAKQRVISGWLEGLDLKVHACVLEGPTSGTAA